MCNNSLRHRPPLSFYVFLFVCVFCTYAKELISYKKRSSSDSCANNFWSRNLSEPNNNKNVNLYNIKLKSNSCDSNFKNDIYTSRWSYNGNESEEKSNLRDDVERNNFREDLYKPLEESNNEEEENNKVEEERKKIDEERKNIDEERKRREEENNKLEEMKMRETEKSNNSFLNNEDTYANVSCHMGSSELLENDMDDDIDSNNMDDDIDSNNMDDENHSNDMSNSDNFSNNINKLLNVLSDNEIDEMINKLHDMPSNEEMRDIWKELCTNEKYKFFYLVYDLRKLYEESIDDIDNINEEEEEIWNTCIFGVGKVHVQASGTYNDLFDILLDDEDVSKEDFVYFVNECRSRLKLLRNQLKDKCEKKITDGLFN
ncbi:Plasmodium exported protein (PHISTc), unknown function [Plasmodium reichenowi]|uniref:Plasmodium RESA N-terminal domain-containing protein n=1 Tax=Plasmodium reichenowi TaxID=5854 RepID=A0A060RP65_PLARE|nr:Plasmodium exported protein (PHISTc), unknown function [Plasmodium reichenowi]